MEEKHRFWVSQKVGQYRYDETNDAAEKICQNTHYIVFFIVFAIYQFH